MGTFFKVILIMADALIDAWLIANGVGRFLNGGTDLEKVLGFIEVSVPLFFITWDRFKD